MCVLCVCTLVNALMAFFITTEYREVNWMSKVSSYICRREKEKDNVICDVVQP